MLTLDNVLSLIAPHNCIICEQEGSLFCALCRYDQLGTIPDRCYMCQALSKESVVCGKCRPKTSLRHVWVTADYEGVAKKIIKLFKFERAQAAFLPIAEEMSETLPYLRPETIITFVPTATSRQRLRGYDHSELLARRIANIKRVKFVSLFERYGQTRQVGSTRQTRQTQAISMFRLKSSNIAKATQIIIVDDILTTGASIESTARVLKKNGFKNISAIVFAQKH